MPGQTIGTVNVQVGSQVNPRVRTISYGGTYSIKGASDLSMAGADNNEVIVYKAATNSFAIESISAIVANVDGGQY